MASQKNPAPTKIQIRRELYRTCMKNKIMSSIFATEMVSAMTGLNESTVRVHLFRAARKLRGLLGGHR